MPTLIVTSSEPNLSRIGMSATIMLPRYALTRGSFARVKFDARIGAIPKERKIRRPTEEKLWINGRVREDSEDWMEQVRAHCERCHDDKDESTQVQVKRIQEQRERRNSREAWKDAGHCAQGAKGPMKDDKELGERAEWLLRRGHFWWKQRTKSHIDSRRGSEGSVRPVFLKKPYAKLEKVDALTLGHHVLLQVEPLPVEWKEFHVTRERCQV